MTRMMILDKTIMTFNGSEKKQLSIILQKKNKTKITAKGGH